MNENMSKLSPDVAPFVPRTLISKNQATNVYDASDVGVQCTTNVDVTAVPTNTYPSSKSRGNYWRSGNPSATPFSTIQPKFQRVWRTQSRCSEIEIIQNHPVRDQGATKASTSTGNDSSQSPSVLKMQKSENIVAGHKSCNAFGKQASFYGTNARQKYRDDIDGEVTSQFGQNKPRTESSNNSLANGRSSATNVVSRGISAGRWTEVTKTKKRSNYSKSNQTSYESASEYQNDKIVPKNKTSSKTDDSRSRTSANLDEPTAIRDENHSRTTENTSNSDAFQTDQTSSHGLSIAAKEGMAKKKKKTDSQRKKEYKNKVKSLPSVEGKVLTVTREFYKLATQNGSRETAHLLSKDNGPEEVLFGLSDFPALGDDSDDQKLSDTFKKKCTVKESQNCDLQNDSDWSDVDPCEYKSTKKCKNKGKCESTKGTQSASIKQTQKSTKMPADKIDGLELCTYAASVKKKSPTLSKDHVKVPSVNASDKGLQAKKSQGLKSDIGPSRKPKAKSLIEFNLVTMLNRNKSGLQSFNKKHGVTFTEGKKMVKVKPVIANILDSSAPSRRRGKERENPAKRKPTAMKKIILREREARKLMRSAPKIEQNEENIISSPEGVTVLKDVKVVKIQEEKINEIQDLETTAVNVCTPAIHTRKFREYCNHMLNPEIDETVTKLIQDLIRFQDRLYQKDPIKAKMRRRLVVGLREVTKHLKLKKLKCIILAPNLEKIISDGGLDEAMSSIISMALEQEIPFVFALGRRGLGRVCLKKVPVSSVGIFNYDGSEANFKHLCTLAMVAQEAYQQATRQGPEVH